MNTLAKRRQKPRRSRPSGVWWAFFIYRPRRAPAHRPWRTGPRLPNHKYSPDEPQCRNALVGVHDKASEFAERAVHEWTGQVFCEDDGPLLSAQYRLMIRTERSKAREKKKYDAVEIEPYTDDQIDRMVDALSRAVVAVGAAA